MKRSRPSRISYKLVTSLLFLWLGVIAGFNPSRIFPSFSRELSGDQKAQRSNLPSRTGTGRRQNLAPAQTKLVLRLIGEERDTIDDGDSFSPNFFIRPALQSDMGRASQILADGFFKGKVNFLLYQWERLETYLSLEANFPRPGALHQVFVACDGQSGGVLGLAEVDVRPTKTRNYKAADKNSSGKKETSTSDGPYMCNLAVDDQCQRQGIASALIQQCERQVQDWYIQTEGNILCSLYLKVRASNQAAIQMYSKLDYMSFRQEDEKKSGETILVMRKELARPVAQRSRRGTMSTNAVAMFGPQ
jgi:ribosomal protein S18 acetylase RimI-like enzyme